MCSKEYIPLKFAELMTVLDVPAEDEEELRDILTELCIEGKIYMKVSFLFCPFLSPIFVNLIPNNSLLIIIL